jgi:hypothetical protein
MSITVGVEWIQDFPPSGSPCSQDSGIAPAPQQNAEGFLNSMVGLGNVNLFDWGDNNAWCTDFQAPAFGGNSPNWSDNVNFCYFSDHGGNNNNVMNIAFSNPNVGCFAFSSQMTLGVNQLKWFVLDCCDMVLGTDANSVASVWFGPTQGVHLVMGFVGLSYVGWPIGIFGPNFGNDVGGFNAIGPAWLNEASNNWWTGQNTAISVACGATQGEAVARVNGESIADVAWDVASTNWLAWNWMS